jgi:hypothetical protein
MSEVDMGVLASGPHADLIRELAGRCIADHDVQAVWVGGSLAAGTGDAYSDVDFRIAVLPGQVSQWINPDWNHYLPIQPCGHVLVRFGETALLHHLLLNDGAILDFYVQDTTQHNPEPKIVILACRNVEFREKLEGFSQPAGALVREIDSAVVRQLFVDYWITTHKQMKALHRRYDHSSFAGLYLERMALLRAWFMQATGKDIDARMTLHMLGALHKGLEGKLTDAQHNVLGLPTRTPEETVKAIDAIRAEMTGVGHTLAKRHAFEYPQALEDAVQRLWSERKESLMRR